MPHPSPIPPPTTAAASRHPSATSLLHPTKSARRPSSASASASYDHHSSDSNATSGSGSESEEEYRPPLTDECLRAEYFTPGMMDSLTAYCTSRGGPRAPAAKLKRAEEGRAQWQWQRQRHVGPAVVMDHQNVGGGMDCAAGQKLNEDGVGDEWREDDEHLAFLRQQAGVQDEVVELVPRAGEAVGQRVGKRRRDEEDRGADRGEEGRDGKRARSDGETMIADDELSYSSFLLAASTSFLVEPVEAAPLPDLSIADTGRLYHHSQQVLGAPWMIIDSLPVSIVSGNLNLCPICLAPLSHPPFDYSSSSSHVRRCGRSAAAPFHADSSDSDEPIPTPHVITSATAAAAECITLPCMHLIHAPCARQSLAANRKCPECRCDVVEAVKQRVEGGGVGL